MKWRRAWRNPRKLSPEDCLKLEAWRKAHPGQPDPNDMTMIAWLASLAYDELMHEWELEHAERELEMAKERGEKPN
jgi:hypothetical protein